MDRIDPQVIIFLVFIVISGLSRLISMFKKARTATSEQGPEEWGVPEPEADRRPKRERNFPEPDDELDPMRDFRRMMERAKEEAQEEAEARAEQARQASPPPLPAPVLARVPAPAPTPAPTVRAPSLSELAAQNAGGKFLQHPLYLKIPVLPNFVHRDVRLMPKSAQKSPLAQLLSTPESARQAVLLAEILGKPKGLE